MSGLNMLSGWVANGDTIMMEQMPMLGAYLGSVEETAISDVAATLASFVLFNCDIHLDGPIHIRWGTTTTRETLKVAAHACAALDKNTDLLLGNQYYTLAGPCTEMCFLETAAQAITDTASGRELISGVASSKGVTQDRTTGMESRIMGEVANATTGYSIPEVNKILNSLVGLYERDLIHAPAGKRFQDCYNVKKILPTAEYINIYDKAISTIGRYGLDVGPL